MENEIKEQQETTEVGILDELDTTDKAIIQLKIENPAIATIEIGRRIGLHRDTVTKRLKKLKVQQAISEYQKTALQILVDTQAEAARRLRTIMRTGKEENAVRACREILKGVLSESFSAKIDAENINSQDDARDLTTDQLKALIEKIKNESKS